MSKQITGNWVYANSAPIANGILYLKLSQSCAATAGFGAQVAAGEIYTIPLTALGAIPTTPQTVILANDELLPAGSYYKMTVNAPGGGRVYGPFTVTITGTSPINLSTLVPVP